MQIQNPTDGKENNGNDGSGMAQERTSVVLQKSEKS